MGPPSMLDTIIISQSGPKCKKKGRTFPSVSFGARKRATFGGFFGVIEGYVM